ncbi:TonB system transport protein ExbD [Pseudomonas sp. RTB3]|nr:TonB system transport protein ExbD [Pseudomonas sp. RTB3]
MGLHLNENSGDDLVENHEINVTPFIDVMLVLLIIFMVAAPLATVDIKVDLPASTAKPVARPEKPLFLSVKTDQSLFLGEEKISREQLGQVLDAKTRGKKDTTIFFQADKGVDYGDLMEVMNALRGAGYLKVGLVGP